MMKQLLFIFFLIAMFDRSYGQKPNEDKSKATVITRPVSNKDHPSKDSTLFNDTEQFPVQATGWTSDFGHIFSIDQIFVLDSLISQFERETTIEIAIVTFDSSWGTKESFDDLIFTIGKNRGVGKKEKDNGILIGISTGLRKIRILNGNGISVNLTDADTKRIIDDTIIPEFKKGNYFEGTKNGLLALMQKIR